ncbi:MAG TPA: hypothetical protein PKA88_27940 [Polyangiaceae bacterium]|nr:hypothetical protein [Polyangiaceae bacterium]
MPARKSSGAASVRVAQAAPRKLVRRLLGKRSMIRWLTLACALSLLACSGSGEGSGGTDSGTGGTASGGTGGGTGGNSSDAAPDAPPPADGPFACGSETCGATQYCIQPCCGGAPPQCIDKPEGGTCPSGFHDGCSFGGCSGNDCCEADPCTPPPAYCADQPEPGCSLQDRFCSMQCA